MRDRDRYSLFEPAVSFHFQQRQRAVLGLLRKHGFTPLRDRTVLEVGCGSGSVLLEYLSYGCRPEHLHGIDLLAGRLDEAHACLPHLRLMRADGQDLPYAAGAFDVVLQYTVFTSILDDAARIRVAREMLRVLKPGGMIVWYDFWLNPTNRQTRGVRPAEIRHLFPHCRLESHRITLAPPLARRIAPRSWLLALLLEKVRVLNSHYLVAVRPQ